MAIKNGDTVRVHYTGRLDDGTIFDSSLDREPLEFTLGAQELLPGFENAVVGLEEGGKVKVNIPAAEAYGEPEDDLMLTVQRDQLPAEITPELGLMLQIETEEGMMDVTITDVTDEHVILDANHPLAGEDLSFDIEVVKIL